MELSKKQIIKLGEKLSKSEGEVDIEDLNKLQEYRKSFKEPLSDIFEVLRNLSIKIDSTSIVTYRIKRINTIINKLRRFASNPNGRMSLDNIGDIAGCRCILKTEEQVYRLRDLLIKKYGNCISDHTKHDYIQKPKEDGYRSLHLYIKHPQHNKKIEIQLRTTEHHNWATLVEIIDLIFGTKIKEGGKEKEQLKKFLFLFSHKDSLIEEEIIELINIEQKNKIYKNICSVFQKNHLNVRKQWLSREKKGCYYVIEASSSTMTSSIENFLNYEDAENAYYDKYISNKESNIVLTYLRDVNFTQLSKAYANYILTIHAFFDDYRKIIENNVIKALNNNNPFKLYKELNIYKKITALYINNLKVEIIALQDYYKKNSITNKYRLKKWEQELNIEFNHWLENAQSFLRKQFKCINGNKLLYLIIRIQYLFLKHKTR